MNAKNELDSMLQTIYPDMVKWRRYMHMHPELSFEEKETSGWLIERLHEMGCDVETNDSNYGLVVRIKGDKPGPVIALRTDFDALPIQDEKKCEYASTVSGVMHACGHDAHAATMLGIASYYTRAKEQLHGERRLIFQPGEELTPGGAVGMIASGALNGVDAIYGVHLWTPLPYGVVASKEGPIMAAPDEIYIDIKGKGGHGGLPHETVDAILVGSAIVQAVQTIVSRNLNPVEPAVISIGSFHAGSTANVIAEHCKLVGTVRTFSEEARQFIKARLQAVVKQTAELYGATAELDYRDGYPPVVNDAIEAERFFKVAAEQFGEDAVEQTSLIMAGEDFSYYLHQVPGCFMFVGAGNESVQAIYPHHHPRFDLDERSMLTSAKLMITMAEAFTKNNSES